MRLKTGGGLLLILFVSLACAPRSASAQPFDEQHIELKIAVLSDLHVGYPMGEAYQKLTGALTHLKTRAGGKLDAVFAAGDLTDTGTVPEIMALKAALTSQLDLAQTPFIFAMGNHEYYGGPVQGAERFKQVFGESVFKNATREEVAGANTHAVIKGFHLIAVNCAQYDGGVKYRPQDLAWLKKELATARAQAPGRPIFVASHPMITGTNWGSEGDFWSGTELRPILAAYPEVIYFAGHLHYPLNDERTIWQGEFTTVGTGAVYYGSLESQDAAGNGFVNFVEGSQGNEAHEFSQGLYLEADRAGNVRLTRMDFFHQGSIKQPWLIPAPRADGSHLKSYTPAQREKNNQPPAFPAGATAALKSVDTAAVLSTMTFDFTQAADDDMVMAYRVAFLDARTSAPMKTVAVYSDFYRHPQLSNMAPRLSASAAVTQLQPMNIPCEKDYIIEVAALDSWGAQSAPIRSEVIKGTPKPPEDPRQKVGLAVHADWDFKLYTDFNAFPGGHKITLNTDYNSLPVGTPQAATHPPIAANGYRGSAGWTTRLNSGAAYYDLIFTQPARGFAQDFVNAKEFWMWVDCSQVSLKNVYVGFRTRALYGGDEYRTDELKGMKDMRVYLQDGRGGWRGMELNEQGCIPKLEGYRGFIRFDARYFYSKKAGASMFPAQLKGMALGFTPADAGQTGRTFVIDHAGFAGPKLAEKTGKVEALLKE